ncbi:hypothetical protein A3SI_11084 [Nitritalea halalkaliphila LW7]|uniref:Uncharacterized protein n=1 Tax=Nitritalea halalkaliphila LW7 TaxID=1189621 RepID=I5C2W7_9BACT|nr:hypothetical protein [Nitritalea halalkaliphila]EIM76169.1 hypothetical protein A3SI_11084 [Nitritalea halalkaliphila LW7]
MKKLFLCAILLFCIGGFAHAQNQSAPLQEAPAATGMLTRSDSLVRAVSRLEMKQYETDLRLYQAKKQLKAGILVATLGYSVTILGGQLLGTRPRAGETLLYVGGGIGIAGTVVLVNGFNKISVGRPESGLYFTPKENTLR